MRRKRRLNSFILLGILTVLVTLLPGVANARLSVSSPEGKITKEQIAALIQTQGKHNKDSYYMEGLSFELANLDDDAAWEIVAKIDGAVHLGQFFIFNQDLSGEYKLIAEKDWKVEQWDIDSPIEIENKKVFQLVTRTGGTGLDVFTGHLWYLEQGKFIEAWQGTLKERSLMAGPETFHLKVGGYQVDVEGKRLYQWETTHQLDQDGVSPQGDLKTSTKVYLFNGTIYKECFDSIEIKNKVDQLLQEIIDNGPIASSNPYDYLKDSKAFAELVALGNPALEYMFESFAKDNEDGLKEYIMASACAKIMGEFDEQKGIGTKSGREWFYKYGVFAKDADFYIVDADYDLFKDTSGKPKLVLPAHTDLKNLEDVISNCILTINRRSYGRGEKAIEAHKIYRTEEKDGIINAYMLVSFRWFGFENNIFADVSGGGGSPVRMQLKKSANGEYEVLEYKRAMDGGMWAQSIREMFPPDLAEAVIKGDKKTSQELWDLQVIKAQKYLEEINRADVPVMSRVAKERGDDKAGKAIYLVTIMRREFPEWNGLREILVRTGGPSPGINVRGVLETECISAGEGQYIITLTKTWNIKINGIQPVSYWKYKVTGERVELIEEQNNDDLIRIIK